MYSPATRLLTPEEFGFPYTPYAIQTELMKSLYSVLEDKAIGIFESPTGTGKSLTLTCAALSWLEDHEKLLREELCQRIKEKKAEIQDLDSKSRSAVDWISAQYETNQQRTELKELLELNALVQDFDQGIDGIRQRILEQKAAFRLKSKIDRNAEESQTEIYYAEELKNADLDFKDDFETKDEKTNNDELEERFKPVQIFFCSRTHSQLAQVVREVRSTQYGQRIRCITLGSRQQLCINPFVKRLKNAALVNERCLDLSKNRKSIKLTKPDVAESNNSKSDCGCPFKKATAVKNLSDTALVDTLDIEDLVIQGSEHRACAYYAARNAAVTAGQLIMLPYQMLLHQKTRKRSGLDLRGAVIIIDEAHNLLDTIAQLHSCEITLKQLTQIKDSIVAYKTRYFKLFSAPNLLCINQLLYVVRRLVNLLEVKTPLCPSSTQHPNHKSTNRTLRTYELSAEGDFFNIDLFELLQFCERTRFAQKLLGFANSSSQNVSVTKNNTSESKENATIQLLQRLQQDNKFEKPSDKNFSSVDTIDELSKDEEKRDLTSVSIYSLLTFLEALTENAEDGRVLVKIDGTTEGSQYRYTVLNPSRYFEDIVREARAIIIAGGTMQPTNELTEQMFRSCSERVRLNFYDHVVSNDAVLPFIVRSGSTGKRLCFNYVQRGNLDMLTELGMILQNLCQVVPAGVVCFLPSYNFLDQVYDHLLKSNILLRISSRKCIFKESSESQKGQNVEQLLKDYAAAIKQKGGAFLFSVVGGKLSEGLNFKDDLCRGVIVVGLPYANSKSTELQERMQYMDTILGNGSGNQYYENLCMKAVNQCIGRAVRHIHDYAAVYLLDERFLQEHIRMKLPQWISRNLQMPSSFGLVQATTAKFFRTKREIDIAK